MVSVGTMPLHRHTQHIQEGNVLVHIQAIRYRNNVTSRNYHIENDLFPLDKYGDKLTSRNYHFHPLETNTHTHTLSLKCIFVLKQ